MIDPTKIMTSGLGLFFVGWVFEADPIAYLR